MTQVGVISPAIKAFCVNTANPSHRVIYDPLNQVRVPLEDCVLD